MMVAQQIENMVCCVYVDIQWAECGLKFGLKDHLRKHLRGIYIRDYIQLSMHCRLYLLIVNTIIVTPVHYCSG